MLRISNSSFSSTNAPALPPSASGAPEQQRTQQASAGLQQPNAQHRGRGGFARILDKMICKSPETRAFNERLDAWVARDTIRASAAKKIKKAWQRNAAELDLGSAQLETLPDCIRQLSNLKILKLNNNRLKELPDGLCELTQLQQLYLDSNRLKELPDGLCKLTQLQQLYLGNNRLGRLPDGLCELTQLQQLYLNNNLVQALPEHIGNLRALHVLSAPYNQISSLPDSVGNLAMLQELDVAENQLLVLPDSLADLRNLSQVHISGNFLQGQPNIAALHGRDVTASQMEPPEVPKNLRKAVQTWSGHDTDASRAEKRVNTWYGYGREPLAEQFSDFVLSLTVTKDFQVDEERFAQEVNEVLDQLAQCPELREKCFMMVVDAATSCGDRTTEAFNNVKKECICHKARNGEYSDLDLVEIGRGMRRLEILEQVAARKVAAMGPDFKEAVEVFLGFQTMLAEEMKLPGASRRMFFRRLSGITDTDLDEARRTVTAHETGSGFRNFMAEWKPWQEALKRMHPEDFERMDEARHEQLAQLDERRDTLGDDDYMREIARIENIMPDWFKARTDEFLSAHPPSAREAV